MTITPALPPTNAAVRTDFKVMLPYLFGALMVLTGCATHNRVRSLAVDELDVSLSRQVEGGSPVLVYTVRNVSAQPICLNADAIQNPQTYYIRVQLRDRRGRVIRRDTPGLIPAPIVTGRTSIAPGAHVSGRYDLAWRFWDIPTNQLSADGWAAQLEFSYSDCPDGPARRVKTNWQPI
jgi:hypothetical protein